MAESLLGIIRLGFNVFFVHQFQLRLDDLVRFAEERVQNVGVKMLATPLFQNLKTLLTRERDFVGSGTGKCVKDICDGDDSAFERNVCAGQTERITLAVPFLVMGLSDSGRQHQ